MNTLYFLCVRICIVEKPVFNVWKVTTGIDIFIHYQIKKDLPPVFEIKWTKDERLLDCKNYKYNGGGLNDGCFSIKSPSQKDAGKYSCSVKNAVGTTKEDFTFGNYTISLLFSQ